ncbi:MAG: hypothetical protein PWQ57_3317 [Desulfovibrionales bacterium]|nr:hypothetical protein [Desulfovibrionales bacterium]
MDQSQYTDLPRHVREAAEMADELMQEQAGLNTPAGDQDGTQDVTPAPEDQKAQAQEDASQNDDTAQDGGEGTPAKAPGADRFEHRYRVLQGKYDKEVPALQHQLRQAAAEIERLRQAEAPKPKGTEAPNPNGQDRAAYRPEDYEEYGEEFVAMARRNAEMADQLKRLEDQLGGVEQQFGQVAQQTQRTQYDRFAEAIAPLCPQFKEQDDDPEFVAWLEYDGSSQAVQQAFAQGDVKRLARIFNRYVQETGATYPSLSEKNDKVPASPEAMKRKLERQIQPDDTAGGGTAPTGKPTYYASQVSEFFKKRSLGQFPFNIGRMAVNTPEDALKIETDITMANVEGRILPG